MAVLPIEQVTQRTGEAIVGYSSTASPIALSETAWHTTTTHPNTVVVTKAVAANQESRDEVDTRVTGDAAGMTL